MNKNRLKGEIKSKGRTQLDCAKACKMSITSFNNKLNGKGSFKLEEINSLVQYLEIDIRTASEIFFTQ